MWDYFSIYFNVKFLNVDCNILLSSLYRAVKPLYVYVIKIMSYAKFLNAK